MYSPQGLLELGPEGVFVDWAARSEVIPLVEGHHQAIMRLVLVSPAAHRELQAQTVGQAVHEVGIQDATLVVDVAPAIEHWQELTIPVSAQQEIATDKLVASQLSKGSSAQFASLVHDVKDLLSLCKLVLHMGDRLAILQLGLGSVPHGHGHNPQVGAFLLGPLFKLLLQPPNQLGLASASRGIQEAAHVGNDLIDKEVLRILVASVCFHEMTPFQASQVQIKAALLVATPPDWQGVSTLILQLEHRIPTPRVSVLL